MNTPADFPSREVIDGSLRDVFASQEFSQNNSGFWQEFLEKLIDILREIFDLPKEQLNIIATVIVIAAALLVIAIIVVIALLFRRSLRLKHEEKAERGVVIHTETLEDALSKRDAAAMRRDFSLAIVCSYHAYLHYLEDCGLITMSEGKTSRSYYYELQSGGYGGLDLFRALSADYLSVRFGAKTLGEERYLHWKALLSFLEGGRDAKTAG